MNPVELPHGAVWKPAKGEIEIPLGSISLRLSLDEFLNMFADFQDIAIAIDTISSVEVKMCTTCGSTEERIIVDPDRPADA